MTTQFNAQARVVRYAVEQYGWIREKNSKSAQAFVAELYERRPRIEIMDAMRAVDLVALVSSRVADPHNWDEIGTALDLLDYMAAECSTWPNG